MKNKGFTLIELIGVIVILGVVAVFSIPALTKTFKEGAEKEYNEYVKNITLAAENYFHSETDGIINGKEFIKVETLIENGYLKKTINPKTKEETSGDATIIISKNEDGTEKYDFVEFDATENGYETDGLILLYDGYNAPVDGFWNDLSGNGNHGEINGPTWDINRLNFDGDNDWINVGIINYENITLEIVLENDVIQGTEVELITNFESGGYGILFSTVAPTRYTFAPYIENIGYSRVSSDLEVVVGKIYSISGSYDGKRILFFDNGTKFEDEVIGNIKIPDNNTVMAIGANPAGSSVNGGYFDGKVYSVRIYDRALTDSEVHNNYMVDKYRFDI